MSSTSARLRMGGGMRSSTRKTKKRAEPRASGGSAGSGEPQSGSVLEPQQEREAVVSRDVLPRPSGERAFERPQEVERRARMVRAHAPVGFDGAQAAKRVDRRDAGRREHPL